MNESASALLAAVERCLPALAAAARRSESLRRLAITDQLTGLYNRRYFYMATDRILAQEAKRGARAALLLYDIDDFKRYNETFGYAVGDEVLRQTAAMMKSISRSHDVVARIGGEEFAVLFWDPHGPRTAASQPLRTAYDLSERFRRAVANRQYPMLGPQAVGTLTISGGLALFPRDGQTVRDLLRSADKALKSAKHSGKNGIRIIGP
jgi:diguanylate cyclase (GGDEF)-like protein